jgi:pimeloyl-ACP methyl ester carboxylesterase
MSFVERTASADGFDVRYMDDGEGPPLVCFHGAGGLRLSRGHELLARTRRVIAFEAPGFGESAANGRSGSLRDLAATMLAAIDAVGLERFALWGTSFGASWRCGWPSTRRSASKRWCWPRRRPSASPARPAGLGTATGRPGDP